MQAQPASAAVEAVRRGDYPGACVALERALADVCEGGDAIGSQACLLALALVAARLETGEPTRAFAALDEAERLAREGGQLALTLRVEAVRARLEAWAGSYEAAEARASAAIARAREAGLGGAITQAYAALGDVAAGAGRLDEAIERYELSLGEARSQRASRDAAAFEIRLAELLLEREGPVDVSAAARHLACAREAIEGEGFVELRLPLRLLRARARALAGDRAGGLGDGEAVIEESARAGRRELEWRAHRYVAQSFADGASRAQAARHREAAQEILEGIAMLLQPSLRAAFWSEPRRRAIREATSRHARGGGSAEARASVAPRVLDGPRFRRLVELIGRLVSEHDVERLLERITDSAVELSGAERGIVLVPTADGTLEARLARRAGGGVEDPSVAFSRSVAEAVLIDGAPIVTVDAGADARLDEYLSVHRLMLKSLACLPIQAQGETFGVLYLEHRLRPGRFLEADLDLLLAFADQAAIALRNARLVSELGKTNAALLEAKLQLEGLVATRTEELEDTRRELDRARDQLQVSYDRHGILGASPAMRRVFAILDRLRDSHVPVVIEGASGTGKELVARAIHHGGSRARGAFVAINCAAIPEPLLESELFGHVRGAFTGANRDRRGLLAQASGGTLFLDEVGDMPAKMQVDLLRVLQDGKVVPVGGAQEEQVDVRIVCATHRSLRALVSSGEFREDLFYRLNVVEVHLPALRERTSDIPLLAERFLRQAAEAEGGAIKRLSRGALAALMAYAFPGNVRELEHLLLNANVMVDGPVIQAEDLAFGGRQPAFVDALEAPEAGAPSPTPPSAPAPPPPAIASVGDFKANEKQQILGTLEATGWNRAKAARRLGMPRRTFYRRLKEYGIIE